MALTTLAQIVGVNVRTARAQRGLTVAELATRSGVSKGTLVGVESGRSNPTIETLNALADALAVPLTDLISAPATSSPVVRRGAPVRRPVDQQRAARMSHSLLTEVWHLRLAAGQGVEREAHAASTTEVVLVHAGTLRCGPIDDPAVLNVGDSITFDASCRHCYQSAGDGDVDATVVMLTTPQGARPL
ncbi:helix-turn-helix domain-containing protein [Austwickia sp. TVS 96-490-7B]|uniref:helix-turn-helix domain-containing protein n=1 Tax=Austwickia sp. TVS 96-490-7B TaxID=2830843 RepID=UPI001C59F942|nr:XRE family transcriptional regulator [Austwickia sp. TVS 96-490-7B]